MSFFGVTLETIDTVRHHPNADRLDICTLVGSTFQFVTGRNEYRKGDKVLYFPVDSILPEDLQEKLGLVGKLSGKAKNRVKTVRLRGEISQGIVAPQRIAEAVAVTSPSVVHTKTEWEKQITDWLGVTKYEPEPIQSKAGNLRGLPAGLSPYDIEGAERYPDAVDRLMDQQVVVTEKIEGMNFSVTYVAAEDKIYVNQRKHSIEPIEGETHFLWQLARTHYLVPWDYHVFTNDTLPGPIDSWTDSLVGWLSEIFPGCDITIYGEAFGPKIQGNIYREESPNLRLFDIMVNGEFLDAMTFYGLLDLFTGHKRWSSEEQDPMGCPAPPYAAPILFVGTLRAFLNSYERNPLAAASHGVSRIRSETIREGIVIRPLIEQRHPNLGRLIIKQRDPIYLANEK